LLQGSAEEAAAAESKAGVASKASGAAGGSKGKEEGDAGDGDDEDDDDEEDDSDFDPEGSEEGEEAGAKHGSRGGGKRGRDADGGCDAASPANCQASVTSSAVHKIMFCWLILCAAEEGGQPSKRRDVVADEGGWLGVCVFGEVGYIWPSQSCVVKPVHARRATVCFYDLVSHQH
jgi:hypothetical protein